MDNLTDCARMQDEIKLEKYIVHLLENTKHYKTIMWRELKLSNGTEYNALRQGKKKKSQISLTLIVQHNTDFSILV